MPDHRVTMAGLGPANYRLWMQRHAYHQAISDIGRGEDPGHNNDSAWLRDVVRAGDGTNRETDTKGAWCSSWVSYRWMTALDDARLFFGMPGLQLGFQTSRSVRILGTNMLSAGATRVDPQDAREADLFFMLRPGGRHVGWITGPLHDGELPTLEGNVGAVPARVGRFVKRPGQLLYILRYS